MKTAGLFLKDLATEQPEFLAPLSSVVTIGRGKGADIVVDDPKCGELHLLIEPASNDRFTLIDLGSQYGTFINKERIAEQDLSIGDSFQIGGRSFYIDQVTEGQKPVSHQSTATPAAPIQDIPELITSKKLLRIEFSWGQKRLDVRTFPIGSEITIGSSKDSTFSIPLEKATIAPFKIAKYDETGLKLKVPIEVHGILWIGQDTISLDSLRHSDRTAAEFQDLNVELRIGDRAHLSFGEMSLDFEFVSPSEAIPFWGYRKLDKGRMRLFMSMLSIWLLISLLMVTGQPEQKEKTIDDVPKHLKKVLFDAGIAQAIKRQQAAVGQVAANMQGGRARGEEGKSSAQKNPEQQKQSTAAAQESKVSPQKTKMANAKSINEAFEKSVDTNVTTDSVVGQKTAGNTASALANGSFARGTKGFGAGGGGESVGIGQLSGLSTGGGMGAGDYGLAPSKGREIASTTDTEYEVQGGLDPEIIAAIIRRYLPQIRHCYEQQLSLHPKLKGKVKAGFVIGGTGSVTSVSIINSTVGSAEVDKCIKGKIANWKFPKPKGGGSVGVKYQFMLMSNSGSN